MLHGKWAPLEDGVPARGAVARTIRTDPGSGRPGRAGSRRGVIAGRQRLRIGKTAAALLPRTAGRRSEFPVWGAGFRAGADPEPLRRSFRVRPPAMSRIGPGPCATRSEHPNCGAGEPAAGASEIPTACAAARAGTGTRSESPNCGLIRVGLVNPADPSRGQGYSATGARGGAQAAGCGQGLGSTWTRIGALIGLAAVRDAPPAGSAGRDSDRNPVAAGATTRPPDPIRAPARARRRSAAAAASPSASPAASVPRSSESATR